MSRSPLEKSGITKLVSNLLTSTGFLSTAMVESNWTSPRRRRSFSHDSPLDGSKKNGDGTSATTTARKRSQSMGDYLDPKRNKRATRANRSGASKADAAVTEDKEQTNIQKSGSTKLTQPRGRSRSRSDASTSKSKEGNTRTLSKSDLSKETGPDPGNGESNKQRTRSRSRSDSVSDAKDKEEEEFPLVTVKKEEEDSVASDSSNGIGGSAEEVQGKETGDNEMQVDTPNSSTQQKKSSIGSDKQPSTSHSHKVAVPISEKLQSQPLPNNQKNRAKTPKNELSKFIPGYTAPLQLSSSLDHQRPGLEALRKQALKRDKTTSAFIKGTLANQQKTQTMLMSKPASSAVASFKKGVKRESPNNAGDKWFGMTPTPMTEELKRDLAVIRNRNYLDPKRFYKSSDKTSKYVQLGTVIEGNTEYYSSRLTKKQRRSNFTEEIMADPASADYTKNKYRKIQQEKGALAKKQSYKKKKGKRQHL